METFELGDVVRMKQDSRYLRECHGEDGTVTSVNREDDPDHGYRITWPYGGHSSLGIRHIFKVCNSEIFNKCSDLLRDIIIREVQDEKSSQETP